MGTMIDDPPKDCLELKCLRTLAVLATRAEHPTVILDVPLSIRMSESEFCTYWVKIL